MGKAIYRAGTVMSGDFTGKNIYKADDNSYVIVSNDENGKIIINSFFTTHYTILKYISKDTIDHYKEISTSEKSIDIALYFGGGEKSLIRLFSSIHYQEIKRMLFRF